MKEKGDGSRRGYGRPIVAGWKHLHGKHLKTTLAGSIRKPAPSGLNPARRPRYRLKREVLHKDKIEYSVKGCRLEIRGKNGNDFIRKQSKKGGTA